jgi:hypothetical protein
MTAGSHSQIGEHRINRSLENARRTLKRGDAESRINFLRGLVRKEYFDAGPVLVSHCLREKDESVLAVLAEAVGRLAGEGGIRALKRLANHASVEIRLGVVKGVCGQLGRPALEILFSLVSDPQEQVRNRALMVLESFPGTEILLAIHSLPREREQAVGLGLLPYLEGRRESAAIQAILRHFSRSAELDLRARVLALLASD